MVRGTKDVLPAFRGAQIASEDKMWPERNGMAEHVGGALWLLISLMSLIVHGPWKRSRKKSSKRLTPEFTPGIVTFKTWYPFIRTLELIFFG